MKTMEINCTTPTATQPNFTTNTPTITLGDDDGEEKVSDLVMLLDSVDEWEDEPSKTVSDKIEIMSSILMEPLQRYGSKATSIKERAIYVLARLYCSSSRYSDVVSFLTGDVCSTFFNTVTKAKCAKVVRSVLDMVDTLVPHELSLQAKLCLHVVSWCQTEKRTFLRQRVEAKLASVLFSQGLYGEALELVNRLLVELKKFDDKQLLVEIHVVEAKVNYGLRRLAQAKAALTASRTYANAIYVSPALQASIDSMSGMLHCEEGDYKTAHSYFLEAFEQLDQLDDRKKAVSCLKYMILCRVLDGLGRALEISANGYVGVKKDKSEVDIFGIISGRQDIKYAGRNVEAMEAIASAASRRSLKQFDIANRSYSHELQNDLLIRHHLTILHEQLLESNLVRIIEPYSCVEISHVASLIEMSQPIVEKKLSQMILDGTLNGILDQGKGHLIMYEESTKDMTMEKALEVITNVDKVVSSLFVRSHAICTMIA